MRRLHYVTLAVLVALTVGSLATTLGYAWYWRSDRYRRYCAQYLSRSLGLPSDIGHIEPRSWHSREFDDVTVWLPGRRGKALFCRQALVTRTPRPNEPHAYEIDLLGGTAEISTRTWLREDYRRVIESGLRPGFDPAGPRCVRFTNMDLQFDRGQFRGVLAGGSGMVSFDSPEQGWAAIRCQALNGYESDQPVWLNARFSPRTDGIRIDQLGLTIPNLPLTVLELRSLVGADVRSGTFNGKLDYCEADSTHHLDVSGTCAGLNLAECTASLVPRPWRGTCPEIQLDELSFENGRPERLQFRGVLTGLVLGDILAPWGLQDATGDLTLRVREAIVSASGIERLVASGECTGVSLATLSNRFDLGRMSGTARLVIDDLTVENNKLHALDADVRVEDAGEARWIEGRLITGLVGRALNLQLPPVLPERIDFTQLGFRLDVRDEQLHVFGSHGPRNRVILTVRLLDRDVPLIFEPENPIELGDWFDRLRGQAAAYIRAHADELSAARIREALHRQEERAAGLSAATTTAPAENAP